MRRGCSAEDLSQKPRVPLKGETKKEKLFLFVFYFGSADAAFQHLPGNTDTSDVLHPVMAGIVLYLKYQSLDPQNGKRVYQNVPVQDAVPPNGSLSDS